MPRLPRRLSDALSPEPDDTTLERITSSIRPPARIERATHAAVAVEHGRGLVAAARARALEYVATEAMQAVAGLTELETLYLRRTPLGEARYRAIADTASVCLAQIVAETGRR
ncbi:hypothetical protein BJF78_07365 [Pseudonocardia sp. CNS-139]|nr:hypothetical protein BJF78_07365 [Pseudonocardia sp. CNS-139]